MRDNIRDNDVSEGHGSQELKKSAAQENAERQRQHVKRKQETHSRLQCWISNRHAEQLAMLGQQLEDSQASIIEQAIDLLYQHELQQTTNAQQSDIPESADMLE
jgi:IS30 family transposase